MLELHFGILLKKINVEYDGELCEVYEVVDYAEGVIFNNINNDAVFHIITGTLSGKKVFTELHKKAEYCVYLQNVDNAIVSNNNEIRFSEIQKKYLKERNGYYFREGVDGQLHTVNDKELLRCLEKQRKKSKFDEKTFEGNTDIATMYKNIKKTIISQDEQIMQILTALFKNQKVINSNLDTDLIAKLKENVLIYGSTGTGKTEILKRIAKLYEIPLVIEDATSLSETGYAGRNITDMLEDLYAATDGKIELAEKGILVIDEFDKLAEKAESSNSYVSRSGVQRSLLKLLDGTTFYLKNGKFDTSKLTIVALGAFTGIIEGDDYSEVTTDHFIKYGVMRELIGRFSKAIPMNLIKKEDIIKILKESDFSPLNTYAKLFEMLNVKFEYNDDFVEYIAELAIQKQSGARSLKVVFDNCISSALFRIFAGEYASISLVRPLGKDDKAYVLTKAKLKDKFHLPFKQNAT